MQHHPEFKSMLALPANSPFPSSAALANVAMQTAAKIVP
jgi:hypothetical protein